MDLLRFSTCGSVDDGKSTLIGRLLYDSKNIFEDQLEAIENSSAKRGDDYTNLALLTDGLRAEREQGITIDVAYRYFATPKRKFIIADTPGHIQYTRNMVTGASTAQLAIVLIDARKGVIEQTRRHSYLVNLLGIKHIVLAVNKMDLVEWSEEVFQKIVSDYRGLSDQFKNVREVTAIPLAALLGDNIVDKSENLPWYSGPTLLEHLESVEISHDDDETLPRLPVQWVIRPMSEEYHDYRAYAGRVAGGEFRVGDAVTVLPSGLESQISAIHSFEGDLESARVGDSISISLEDELDISRGDILVRTDAPLKVATDVKAHICWFSPKPLKPRGKYFLRAATREVQAMVMSLDYRVEISTLETIQEVAQFELNEIGGVTLKLAKPLAFEKYDENRVTGSFILVDAGTNETVAAGMIE